MSRSFMLSVAGVLLLGACADNILKERPVRSSSTAGSAVSMSTGSETQASICRAYRRQLHAVKVSQLTQRLSSQAKALKAKELSLNAIIADACE
jgi:hypothetical protein